MPMRLRGIVRRTDHPSHRRSDATIEGGNTTEVNKSNNFTEPGIYNLLNLVKTCKKYEMERKTAMALDQCRAGGHGHVHDQSGDTAPVGLCFLGGCLHLYRYQK